MRQTRGRAYVGLAATATALVLGLGLFSYLPAQLSGEDAQQRLLRGVFPLADSFSSRGGKPPHYKAYRIDPDTEEETLVGFVFFTTDVEPLERGYEGPIEIMVGMDTAGVISAIRVMRHHEPYGWFSIEPFLFSSQFREKSILDPFRIGRDIDGVSRATITISSATRVIRKSARRIAKQYLEQR